MSGSPEADRLGHDSEAIAGFLPLVDVLLAVLCVAMVLAGKAAADRQVPVKLPGGSAAATVAQPTQPVRLTFDSRGGLWLDGEATNEANLGERLRRLGRDRMVVIGGDTGAEFGRAARLLLLVREAGIEQIGLAVGSAAAAPFPAEGRPPSRP